VVPPAFMPKPRLPLRCKWCRGHHATNTCPNPKGVRRKRFGTLDRNRDYVPPPGLEVPVLSIPSTVHGDSLAALLKNIGR